MTHRIIAVIALVLIVVGCDNSANKAAKQTYLTMLAKIQEVGLDVSSEPTEDQTTAWYEERTPFLYLNIASTLEAKWREAHCTGEPTDCYAQIDRRLLQLTNDGTLPPLPADASEAEKALDATVGAIHDLAPSREAFERYQQERLGHE